jgi:ATPase subunit of ABC transporter with duplicated ATPase domains
MIDLSLKNIQKYYGANKVLEDITFEVKVGEKIGLIGGNGSGKTTILKIIAGIEDLNGGTLSIRKGATVGYLDQIPVYPDDYRVMDILNSAFEDIYEIKNKMRYFERQMGLEEGKKLEDIMRKYGELQSLFEYKGGYQIDEKINKVCGGLKMGETFTKRRFTDLSGGEKTTVILGKILLQNPDILLLDEPSNHLDIESVEWLEEYLKEYGKTVLIVSHDRYFLDRVVSKIVEVERGNAYIFNGNYSYYLEEKERRLNQQLELYNNQQKKIKAMEDAIKRFRDWGTRADNEAMFKKAKNMEKRIERMEKIDKPILEKPKIKVNFIGGRSGKDVISIEGLKKGFKNNILLDSIDLKIRYGERVAILGKNGAGKSTLLKLIMNHQTPDEGNVKIGSGVNIGYIEQEVVFSNEENTVLIEFIENVLVSEGEARNLLARFLFRNEDVFKKVKNLSGGEKTKLKLCIMMHKDINTLILDEPTNHLDIDSREMLEKALSRFNGTIVFVSHDRYFINKISNRVIEVENKKLVDYHGNYEFYKSEKLKRKNLLEKNNIKSETKKIDNYKKQKNIKHQNSLLKDITSLEKEIENLEEMIKRLDSEMEKHSEDYIKLNRIYSEKIEAQKKLDKLIEEWVELSE